MSDVLDTALDVQWTLPVDRTLPRDGRLRVLAALATAGFGERDTGTVALLVSEVLANVVRHTDASTAVLAASAVHGSVRVTVTEQDASGPAPAREVADPRMPDTSASHGRGLALLDEYAEQWGISRRQHRTTTWFTVTLTRPESDDSDDRDAELVSVRAALRRSQMLLRLTESLGRAETDDDLAAAVTRLVRAHVGAQFTGLALLEPDGGHLRFVSLDPLPERITPTWSRFPIDATAPVAAAAATATAFFHESPADAEAEFPGIAAHMAQAETGAMAHVPLVADNRPLGVLSVTFSHPRGLDADLRALLTIVAGYAAQALRRRR